MQPKHAKLTGIDKEIKQAHPYHANPAYPKIPQQDHNDSKLRAIHHHLYSPNTYHNIQSLPKPMND